MFGLGIRIEPGLLARQAEWFAPERMENSCRPVAWRKVLGRYLSIVQWSELFWHCHGSSRCCGRGRHVAGTV